MGSRKTINSFYEFVCQSNVRTKHVTLQIMFKPKCLILKQVIKDTLKIIKISYSLRFYLEEIYKATYKNDCLFKPVFPLFQTVG